MTKLGRLVKAGKIKNMEEIYLHSLPIKEYQIVDFFLPTLKDEVMKVWISVFSFSFLFLFLSLFLYLCWRAGEDQGGGEGRLGEKERHGYGIEQDLLELGLGFETKHSCTRTRD